MDDFLEKQNVPVIMYLPFLNPQIRFFPLNKSRFLLVASYI